jgi:hypothetical protein
MFGFAGVGDFEDCNENFQPSCQVETPVRNFQQSWNLPTKSEGKGNEISRQRTRVMVTVEVVFDEQDLPLCLILQLVTRNCEQERPGFLLRYQAWHPHPSLNVH